MMSLSKKTTVRSLTWGYFKNKNLGDSLTVFIYLLITFPIKGVCNTYYFSIKKAISVQISQYILRYCLNSKSDDRCTFQ